MHFPKPIAPALICPKAFTLKMTAIVLQDLSNSNYNCDINRKSFNFFDSKKLKNKEKFKSFVVMEQ